MQEFLVKAGWEKFIQMLVRIEENIELLKPCMKTSTAIARGEKVILRQSRSLGIDSPKKSVENKFDGVSVDIQSDIQSLYENNSIIDEKFYGYIISGYLNMIFNEILSTYPDVTRLSQKSNQSGQVQTSLFSPNSSSFSLQNSFATDSVLRNMTSLLTNFNIYPSMYDRILGNTVNTYHIIRTLPDLIFCGHPRLILSSIRIFQLLLFSDNENSIYIELSGILEVLNIFFGCMVLTNSIPTIKLNAYKADNSDDYDIVNYHFGDGIYSKVYKLQLFSQVDFTSFDIMLNEVTNVLNIISVTQTHRDISMIAYCLSILLSLDDPATRSMTNNNADLSSKNFYGQRIDTGSTNQRFRHSVKNGNYVIEVVSANGNHVDKCQNCDSDLATVECFT